MKDDYDLSKATRGAVTKNSGKTRITIFLDDDILSAYRKKSERLGRGYQTLINDALRDTLQKQAKPLDARTLRRIVREELEKVS